MSTTALTTASRFLVRRKRPNRPSVDNAFPSSWCPHYGVRFSIDRPQLVLRLRSHAASLWICSG